MGYFNDLVDARLLMMGQDTIRCRYRNEYKKNK